MVFLMTFHFLQAPPGSTGPPGPGTPIMPSPQGRRPLPRTNKKFLIHPDSTPACMHWLLVPVFVSFLPPCLFFSPQSTFYVVICPCHHVNPVIFIISFVKFSQNITPKVTNFGPNKKAFQQMLLIGICCTYNL